jgi:hypothetical protein
MTTTTPSSAFDETSSRDCIQDRLRLLAAAVAGAAPGTAVAAGDPHNGRE